MRAAALLVLIGGCTFESLTFQCSIDSQCSGNGGICVERACAFSAQDCPSGYRWDDSANAGRRGQCTPNSEADLSTPDLRVPDDLSTPVAQPDLTGADFAGVDLVAIDLTPQPDLAVATPPSCMGSTLQCGPNMVSCCSSPIVQGGPFDRSYDGIPDGGYNDPSFAATVSDFRLDSFEVTVGRFRKFVEAGQGTQASPPPQNGGQRLGLPGTGWDSSYNSHLTADTTAFKAALKCDPTYQTWTDTAGANENLPMACLTWYEALAFCVWDKGFLPTEAEWNYAAAGGSEQRAYPWSQPPTSLALDDSYAVYMGGATAAAAVGSKSPKGDGKWGQADLVGNLSEWVIDWFYTPYQINPCTNCAEVAMPATDGRVTRGGSYSFAPATIRTGFRVNFPPSNRYAFFGVRCARLK